MDKRAAAGRAVGTWLVALAADRKRRCDRAALAAGVAAPWWERPHKIVARSRLTGWWGTIVDRKQKGGGGGHGDGCLVGPARRRPEEALR